MPKKIPNAIDKHVGTRVRMRRMMIGISQEKLGHALGITFQQIQKYEKGTNRIGGSRMAQIANILGVPVGFFYEGAPGYAGTEAPEADGELADFLAKSTGLSIVRNWPFLSANDRKAVAALVDNLAASRRALDTPIDVQVRTELANQQRLPLANGARP